MIRIKCGTCGTSKGYKTGDDGALTLPNAEERRLVTRGVAEYVTRPIINPASDVDSAVEVGDAGGAGITPPDEDPLENGGSEVSRWGSAETLNIVDGHFTRDSLLLMRRSDMEKLAGDLGVDVSRCKNKGDIADLLIEVEVEAPMEDGGEAPPELDMEVPLV